MKNKRIKGNTLLEAVCSSVHERRELLGISQEELAARAGLHRTYISDIERGARNPSLKTLSRLADALELNASDLIKMGERKAAVVEGKEPDGVGAGIAELNPVHG